MGNQLPAFTYKEIKTYFHKHPCKADHVTVKTFSVRFSCRPGDQPVSISSLQPPFNATRGERAILDSVVLDGRTLTSRTPGVRVILTGSTTTATKSATLPAKENKKKKTSPLPTLTTKATTFTTPPASSAPPPPPSPSPVGVPVEVTTPSPSLPPFDVSGITEEIPGFVGVPVPMNKDVIFKRVQTQLGWQRGILNEARIAPGIDDFVTRDILFQRSGISSGGLAYLLGANMPLTFREGLKITNDPLIRLIIEKSLLDEKSVIPFPISTGIPEIQLDPTNVPVYIESEILGILCDVIKEQVSDKITWLKDEGGVGFRVHWPEGCKQDDILILSFTVTYILQQDISTH